MGYLFEELVRKFNEQANEEAGDHFTPREVIRLMVQLLFTGEDGIYEKGIYRSVYDPTAGTGGMLSESEKFICGDGFTSGLNPDATHRVVRPGIQPRVLRHLLLRSADQG
jgi:type I restriction enzyme M protein